MIDQKNVIMKMLIQHFENYGLQANPNQLRMWLEQLEGIEAVEIYASMKKTWSDSNYAKPAMPPKLIEIAYGFLNPNEAWAKVESLNGNEAAALVWNEEMRLAWGDSYSLISSGDMIAARMTFIESYRRRISESVNQKRRPKYCLTAGAKDSNEAALIEAVVQKKITPHTALSHNPDLKIPKEIINSLQIESSERILLTHKIEEAQKENPENKTKIRQMIDDFLKSQNEAKEKMIKKRAEQREQEKLDFQNKKQAQILELNKGDKK